MFTQIWNAFPKGVGRFHPEPEHKKDIWTSGARKLGGLISTFPPLSCGAAFGAITVSLIFCAQPYSQIPSPLLSVINENEFDARPVKDHESPFSGKLWSGRNR